MSLDKSCVLELLLIQITASLKNWFESSFQAFKPLKKIT